MVAGKAVVAAAAIFVIVMGLAAFVSIGAPGAPTAQLSGTLNPSVAQTVQITLESQVYSTVVPNSIFNLGSNLLYTVTYWNAANQPVNVLFNQHAAASVLTSTGFLYTIGTTISVSIPALCTASTCGTFIENLTVTATAQVQSYATLWASPISVIAFSTAAIYQHIPALTAPYAGSWLGELTIPITAAIAVVAFIAFGFKHHPYAGVVGVLSVIALLIEVVLFVLL
jgi:hypothetical protein